MTDERIAWTESMSVGIPELDADHQALVEIINDLISDDNQHPDIIIGTLDRLVLYAQSHFNREESLFKASNYPFTEAHLQEHDNFLHKLAQIQHEIANNRINGLSANALSYLRGWLLVHIMRSDKGYSTYLTDRSIIR